MAYGADVASHSYTGSDDDPAAADDVVTEESATEEPVAEEPAEPVETDPAEEMRAALRRAPGDWYVVHSYAGYENKVKTNLETRVQTLDVEDFIFQVEVPTEEVTEIKNGQRKQVQRKVLPGYILVRMELNDQSWGAVRNTPGVTGFVGATSKPSALTIDEVVKFLLPRTEAAKPAGSGRSIEASDEDAPAPAVALPGFLAAAGGSRNLTTSLSDSGDGREVAPTKPVTPGVLRTAPHDSSLSSMRTRM